MIAACVPRPAKKASRTAIGFGKIVLFDGAGCIPFGFADLDSFCEWAASDHVPERGRFSFMRGQLWMDLEMEQLFLHNMLKLRIAAALDQIATGEKLGYAFTDEAALKNVSADLGTEPDAMFVSFDSINEKRVRSRAKISYRILILRADGFHSSIRHDIHCV